MVSYDPHNFLMDWAISSAPSAASIATGKFECRAQAVRGAKVELQARWDFLLYKHGPNITVDSMISGTEHDNQPYISGSVLQLEVGFLKILEGPTLSVK